MSKRELFIETFREKLAGWQTELSRLETKAGKIDAQNLARYRATRDEVAEKLHNLDKRLTMIKSSSAGAWQDLKQGVEKAWDDLESSLKKARDKFTAH